jgi:hypothetical protein
MPNEPNVYSVWIALINGVAVPVAVAIAGVLSFWLNRKLNNIHTLVNGNLHTAQTAVAKLRAKLTANGLDPDSDD